MNRMNNELINEEEVSKTLSEKVAVLRKIIELFPKPTAPNDKIDE